MMHYIILPMIVANIAHMIVVKKDCCSRLAVPIARQLFGANKTWRGFLVVPFLGAAVLLLMNVVAPQYTTEQAMVIGFGLGVVYMLSELPNSYLKRRLGIGAGEAARRYKWLFMLLDKSDSSLGITLFCWLGLRWHWSDALLLFLVGIGVHTFFSWFLVLLKVKKRF